MKIGIDVRLWNETGVGRYIRNLVANLSAIDHETEYILFARTQDEKAIRSMVNSQWSIANADVPWHGVWEQVLLPRILNEQSLDLMHFPYFSVPFFYRRPYVVTVHDLIVNRFNTGRASTLPYPLYFAKRIGYQAVLGNAVYRAKNIVVPSNAVKDDLLKTYPYITPSKIEVTYEGGFESSQKLEAKSQKLIEGRYLLRVGNFYPHKNVEGLLSAFKDFLDDVENRDIRLVLVGKRDYFYKRIEENIKKLNISSNVVFLPNASDSELFSLYKNAVATVVPSFQEGFSLTAVEAMACGSPVIASDIPVHREVCQDAAMYCNPGVVNDIKQKINFACSLTSSSRKEFIEQGKKRVKQFSWEKMAKETLAIYQSA